MVVGAGITGLTTAFTLATRHPGIDVTVVEAADRVGGKILTTPFAGRPVDCGADAFLARVPEAVELCDDLGLSGMLTSPAARDALVWSGAALRRLPAGLVLGVPTDLDALAASGIVSPEGVARAAQDLERDTWDGGGPPTDPEGADDVSVGALVRARLGDEVYVRLVAPLLSGVNAGDADQLSLATGAAQLAVAARRSPSLIAGLRAQQAAARAGADPSAPAFYGIPVGSQTITDLLLARLTTAGVPVHLGCPVSAIHHDGRVWTVDTPLGPLAADRVVLTLPAPVTARLVEPVAADVAAEIGALAYASVAMVTLAVPRGAVDVPLDASGFLVAPSDRLPTLTACSWASSKWAHLADPELVILRVSAGRFGDTTALELDDADLVEAIGVDLRTTMGITAPPIHRRVTRWIDGLPQFRPGHLGRVRRWREHLTDAAPGLILAGAAYDGLGLPACIRQGRRGAELAAHAPEG